MSGIIWLASYPKSGSTWTRIFLHRYLDIGPLEMTRFQPDHNGLFADPIANFHPVFDEMIGLSASELGPEDVTRLRFALHGDLAQHLGKTKSPRPPLVKTHDAFLDASGQPQFRPPETAGAVVLVRNPLDVAPSYASFLGEDIDTIIARMARQDVQRPTGPSLPQDLGSWSTNVQTWTHQTQVPVLVLRYEDMLEAPDQCFADVLRFLGAEVDQTRLADCVAETGFEKLRAVEDQHSANRPQDRAHKRFFRRGQAGDWRQSLTRAQVQQIVDDHGEVMESFGYLPPALDWLSSPDQSTT